MILHPESTSPKQVQRKDSSSPPPPHMTTEECAKEEWPVLSDKHRLVKSLNTVATTNFRNGRLDRALTFYEEALVLARSDMRVINPRDEQAVAHAVQSAILLASTLNSIAVIRWSRGMLEHSRLAVDEAMETIEMAGPKISALVLPTSPRLASSRKSGGGGKSTTPGNAILKQLFTDLKWVKCTTMFNQGILHFLECDFPAAMEVFEATLYAQTAILGHKAAAASSTVARTKEYLDLCRKQQQQRPNLQIA